jgi:hypothetical protein
VLGEPESELGTGWVIIHPLSVTVYDFYFFLRIISRIMAAMMGIAIATPAMTIVSSPGSDLQREILVRTLPKHLLTLPVRDMHRNDLVVGIGHIDPARGDSLPPTDAQHNIRRDIARHISGIGDRY